MYKDGAKARGQSSVTSCVCVCVFLCVCVCVDVCLCVLGCMHAYVYYYRVENHIQYMHKITMLCYGYNVRVWMNVHVVSACIRVV